MTPEELNTWLTEHIDAEAKAVAQAERANASGTAAMHQYGRSLLLELRVAIDAADELGGHTLFVCDGQHDDYGRSCMFCDGGLSACATCGAFEGAWTTHCPHVKVDGDTWDKVYAGELDYRNGRWVSEASPHCPSGFRKAMREAADFGYHYTGGAGPEWTTWHEHNEAGHRHKGGEKPHGHPAPKRS